MSQRPYTVGPWVTSGLAFPMPIYGPGLGGPALSKYTTAIRVVEEGDRNSRHPPRPAVDNRVDNTHVHAAMHTAPSLHVKSENTPPRRPTSLRLYTKTPETPPTGRRRGQTDSALRTPPRDADANGSADVNADADADARSIVSFSPSMRGKHLTTWFSGLLGR